MITAFLVGDKELIARLNAMPGGVRSAVLQTVRRLGFDLQRKVQSEKLSGQVLKVRTGLLRSSINTRVQDTSTSVTATVGTNVKYAHAHEYGFHGTVSVRAHLRHVTQVFGRPISAVQNVGAYSRQMNLPERSFLRSAFRELTPQIKSDIETAVRNTLRQTIKQ